jgi:hypothetical protein
VQNELNYVNIIHIIPIKFSKNTLSRKNHCVSAVKSKIKSGSAGGWLTKEGILALVFFLGAARAFEGPSMQSMVPNLVTS